jgi:hypothetical protein
VHPTIQEQLAGATRLLDAAIVEPGSPVAVIELVTNARRLVRQAERAWATLPVFHATDNAALVRLLADLEVDLPPGWSTAHVPLDLDQPAGPLELGERNAYLRSLLTDAIGQLSRAGRTDELRQVHHYLHDRALSDPSS